MADTISRDRYLIQFEVDYGQALSALQEAQAALSAVEQAMSQTATSARALGESAVHVTEFARAMRTLQTTLGKLDVSQLPAISAAFRQVQSAGEASAAALATSIGRIRQEVGATTASLQALRAEMRQLATVPAGAQATGEGGAEVSKSPTASIKEATEAVKEFLAASEALNKLPAKVSQIAKEFAGLASSIDAAAKAMKQYAASADEAAAQRKKAAASYLEPPPQVLTNLPPQVSIAASELSGMGWSPGAQTALIDAYVRRLAEAAARATVPGQAVPTGMLSWQAEILELAAGPLIREQLEKLRDIDVPIRDKLSIAAEINDEIRNILSSINIPIEYYGQQVVARLRQSVRDEMGRLVRQTVEFLPVGEKGGLGRPVALYTVELGKQGEVLKETVELYNKGSRELRILQDNTDKAARSAAGFTGTLDVWNRMFMRHVMWVGQAILIYQAMRIVASILSDITQGYIRLEQVSAMVAASMREQASAAAIASRTMQEAARYGVEWQTAGGAIGIAMRLGMPELSEYGLGFARLGVDPERMQRLLYTITRMFPEVDMERMADAITAAWQKSGMSLEAFVGSIDTAVAMSEIFNMGLYETIGLVSFLGRATGQSGDQLERFTRIMQTFYTDTRARTFIEQIMGRPVVGPAGERVPLTEILTALSRQEEWVWRRAAEFLPSQLGQPHRPYFVAIMKQFEDYKAHMDEITKATGAFGDSVEKVMNTSAVAVDRLRQAWKGLLAEMGWPLAGILTSLAQLLERATEQRMLRRYLAEYGELYRRATGREPVEGMRLEYALYEAGLGAPIRGVREDFRRFVDEIMSGQRDALTGALKAGARALWSDVGLGAARVQLEQLSADWSDVGRAVWGMRQARGLPGVDLSLFGGTANLRWVQYQPTEDIARRIQTVYNELLERAKNAGVKFEELGETVTIALVNPLTGATQAVTGFSNIMSEATSIVEKNLDLLAALGLPETFRMQPEIVEWEFTPEQLAEAQRGIDDIIQRYRERLIPMVQEMREREGRPILSTAELDRYMGALMDAMFGAEKAILVVSETGESAGILNVRIGATSQAMDTLRRAAEDTARALSIVSWGLTPELAAQAPGILKDLTEKVASAATQAYGGPLTEEQWEELIGAETLQLVLDRTTGQFIVLNGPVKLLGEVISILAERARDSADAMREEERARSSVAQKLESWIDAIMENTRVTAEDLYYLTPRGEYEDKFAEPIRRLRAVINWLQAGSPAGGEQPYYRPTMALFGVPTGLSPEAYEGLYERLSRQWTTGGFLGRPDWSQFYNKELFLREVRRRLEEYRSSRALREMQLTWLREAGIADEFLKMEAAAAPATQILFGGLAPKEYADAVGKDYGAATKESIIAGVSLTAEEGKEIASKTGASLQAGVMAIGPQVFGPIGEEVGSIMVDAMASVFRQEGTVKTLGQALGEQIAQHLRQYIVQSVVDMLNGVTPP